jgi:hypothetical protein
LLDRICIAVDINYDAVIFAHHRLYYLARALRERGWQIQVDVFSYR